MDLSIFIKAPKRKKEPEKSPEFKEHPLMAVFSLPPEKAIAFFKDKGLDVSFTWQDIVGDEHLKAFVIAKMMEIDLLADTQAFLTQAMKEVYPLLLSLSLTKKN